jgi:hypothetical protein
VRVRLFDKTGVERGMASVTVAPKGLTQLNHAVRQLVNASDVSNLEGYIRLESDQPIFGWASEIDNITNDPGFAASKNQGSGRLVVQSTANVGNFRSSLVVVNTGSADALVDLVSRSGRRNPRSAYRIVDSQRFFQPAISLPASVSSELWARKTFQSTATANGNIACLCFRFAVLSGTTRRIGYETASSKSSNPCVVWMLRGWKSA